MSINARIFASCVSLSACVFTTFSSSVAVADTESLVTEAGETAVYIPEQYGRDRQWPLVILLHGAGATGDMQDLHLGISERVSAKGFILAVPEARVAGSGSNADFLLGLVGELKQKYQIDDQKVFLIGHSMGGYQSLRFACDHGDVIAGMVISAAAGVCETGRAPVRLLLATGDADISDAHVIATTNSWRRVNGCTESSSLVEGFDLHWDIAGSESALTAWSECAANSAVASLRSRYGRHIPIFRGEFAQVALDFLLTGVPAQAPARRSDCVAEGDDRRRFVKHSLNNVGQQRLLTVQEFADSECTRPLSTVTFAGPAASVARNRAPSSVYPLRFESVGVTVHDVSVAVDLSNGQGQETPLCNQEWQPETEYSLSGRDSVARRSCLTSVGNIAGPASFIKKLLLSYMFAPALP